jgi:predicted aldo/keto reductase-like oxidoreductase
MVERVGCEMGFCAYPVKLYRLASCFGYNVNADYLYAGWKRGIPIFVMEPLQGGRLSKLISIAWKN